MTEILYDPVARFEAKTIKDGPLSDDRPDLGPCWIWVGKVNQFGYGRFNVDHLEVQAHRWSYEHHVGPIPNGLEVDHLCFVRNCVNPKHLEAVTGLENQRRAARRLRSSR